MLEAMDPDIFAIVCAKKNNQHAHEALKREENSHYFVDSDRIPQPRSAREATPGVPLPYENCENGSLQSRDRLVLRFSDLNRLKDKTAVWLFGYSGEQSDIVICNADAQAVSRRHFALWVDKNLRIKFHRLSELATELDYINLPNAESCIYGETRWTADLSKHSNLLVSMAPNEPKLWDHIEVTLMPGTNAASFEIHFPNHPNVTSPTYSTYLSNLYQWLALHYGPNPIQSYGRSNLENDMPTDMPAPNIYYETVLGFSSSSVTKLKVNLRDGDQFVQKTLQVEPPYLSGCDDNRFHQITNCLTKILRLKEQENVVQVVEVDSGIASFVPYIKMPYYPLGSIKNHEHRLSQAQYKSVFRQILLGLKHLHEQGLIHGNLIRSNILVKSFSPLHIVVSDYSLKPGNHPCLSGSNDPFRKACETDIRDAGSLMLQWSHPEHEPLTSDRRKTLEDLIYLFPDCPLLDLLTHMVCGKSELCYTAMECLDQGCTYNLFKKTVRGEYIDSDANFCLHCITLNALVPLHDNDASPINLTRSTPVLQQSCELQEDDEQVIQVPGVPVSPMTVENNNFPVVDDATGDLWSSYETFAFDFASPTPLTGGCTIDMTMAYKTRT